MKKMILSAVVLFVACVFATPTYAQFGKGLKNLGKTVTSSVTSAAGDMAADAAANSVSIKVANWMDNNNTIADEGSDYYKRLSKLVSPNYVAVDGAALNYKVYLNPEVNIIGTADGSIRIYSGLMDLLSDAELLGVISVQIGHIANKDVRDALLKVASEGNAAKASAAQLEKLLSFSGEKLGTIVNELMQVPYSDKENEAADKFAAELLKKNGASTQGLKSALNKFAELEANDKKAESDDTIELSPASKYISVNSGNANRAAVLP